MQSGPTIRASVLSRFDAFMAGKDVKLRPLLAQVGLKQADLGDPEKQVPLNAVATLLELAAHACNDPCLGLHFAEFVPAGSSGLMGHLLMSAPTPRDALEAVERYIGLLIMPVAVSFRVVGGKGTLVWTYPETFTAPRLQYSGFATGALINRLAMGGNRPIRPSLIELDHLPFACPQDVRRVLGPRVRYNRPRNLMIFDAAALNRRSDGVVPGLFELIQQLGDRMLEEQRHEADIVALTQRQIANRLKNGGSDLPTVARAFGISPRALQGRLKRSGTTFDTLVSTTRQQRAEGYLRDTGLSMTEIAMLLGFSELSAFTRAAQRWFGMSPTTYRNAVRR